MKLTQGELIPLLLPKTKIRIEDIQKQFSSWQTLLLQCDESTKKEFFRNALNEYLVIRSVENNYHNPFWYRHSKNEKLAAAQALLNRISEQVDIKPFLPALNNGRLFSLFNLFRKVIPNVTMGLQQINELTDEEASTTSVSKII